ELEFKPQIAGEREREDQRSETLGRRNTEIGSWEGGGVRVTPNRQLLLLLL
ncbi:unnamed protein product, partial [Musa hybrid cultivar]